MISSKVNGFRRFVTLFQSFHFRMLSKGDEKIQRSIYVNIKPNSTYVTVWLYLTNRKVEVLTVVTWSRCHGHTEKIKIAFYSIFQGLS